MLRHVIRDRSGATAIEYGLLAAILGIGIVTSLTTLEGNLSTLLANVGTNLN